jgi:hypothetical protein
VIGHLTPEATIFCWVPRRWIGRSLWDTVGLSEALLHWPQPTDEVDPIPMGYGSEEAWKCMWAKIEAMSDEELLKTWDLLDDYNPRNYYDKSGKIGMDSWADSIQVELSRRHLPVKY